MKLDFNCIFGTFLTLLSIFHFICRKHDILKLEGSRSCPGYMDDSESFTPISFENSLYAETQGENGRLTIDYHYED